MKNQSSKDKGQDSSKAPNKNPLTVEDLISYEKFLLSTTYKTIRQAKESNSIMDRIIAELESSIATTEEECLHYEGIVERDQREINAIKEEYTSEETLLSKLKPKMEIMETTTNQMLAKAEEYETSCLRLEKLKAELAQEQNIHEDVKKELITKERNVDTIRKDIEWQDKEISRLFKLLKQSDAQNEEMFILKKKLNNDLQEVKGNIRVYCRVRPSKKGDTIVQVTSDNTLKMSLERERIRQEPEKIDLGFVFEQIFNEAETQDTIFTQLSQLVQNSIDGKNVCIFAYGQTGSGKTYTLLGPEEAGRSPEQIYHERGLAPRSIELIFKQIEHSRKFKWIFKTFLSIQQIYLENINDLIGKSETVKDKCTEVQVREGAEVLAFIKEAVFNRKKACTAMNERSSRSHLIITLRLEGFSQKNEDKRNGSLVFIDLAGSERLKTSRPENGEMLKETQFINKSLSSLVTVIAEMREKKHVSFRNTKLTHVLQRYLEGDGKTLMFVNISPDREDAGPTRISLRLADQVGDVKMKK